MTKREIEKQIRGILKTAPDNIGPLDDVGGDVFKFWFLGTSFSLDPCGRYHCVIDMNGARPACIRYWENLNAAAEKYGAEIISGDGDACDVFLAKLADDIPAA
jgi:hypothetical protein